MSIVKILNLSRGRETGRSGGTVPPVFPELLALWLTGAVSVLLPVFVWSGIGGPVRGVVVALAAVLIPGVPVALAFYPTRRRMWLALAPVLSFSVLVLLSMGQLLTNLWYPMAASSVEGLTGLLLIPLAARRTLRAARTATPAPDTDPRPISHRRTAVTVGTLVVTAASFGLWASALHRVDLDATGARGLIAVAPLEYFVGLALLLGLALWLLLRGWDQVRPPHLQLALATAALMVQITTFVAVADGGAVVGTGYVHVGFINAIDDLGRTVEGFDARFSWPGFFAAFAALRAWSGADSMAGVLPLYPAVTNILFIPMMLVLGRRLTGSDRVAWGGVLIFSLVNWVQQDYFSPQSLAFLLYFAVIAVMVTETADKEPAPVLRWLRTTPGRAEGRTGRGERGVEVLLLVMSTTMVLSHQLTPVALVTTLVLFGITGVVRQRSLWIGVGVVFVAWFAYGAQDWWSGNLSVILDGFGKSQEALNAGISGKVQGSAAYRQMQQLRIVFTALLGLAAVAGWFFVRGAWRRVCSALLVAAPVSLVAMQTYGGEVILRVVLYSSPVLAVLTAAAVARLYRPWRSGQGSPPSQAVKLGVLVVGAGVVAVTGVAARGTNTAFERNPASTIEAARTVLDNAPAGSIVVPVETDAVLRMDRVGELTPATLSGEGDVARQIMDARPDFVFFSSSREAYEHILHGTPEHWFSEVSQDMLDSGDYEVFTRTATVTVLRRTS